MYFSVLFGTILAFWRLDLPKTEYNSIESIHTKGSTAQASLHCLLAQTAQLSALLQTMHTRAFIWIETVPKSATLSWRCGKAAAQSRNWNMPRAMEQTGLADHYTKASTRHQKCSRPEERPTDIVKRSMQHPLQVKNTEVLENQWC